MKKKKKKGICQLSALLSISPMSITVIHRSFAYTPDINSTPENVKALCVAILSLLLELLTTEIIMYEKHF